MSASDTTRRVVRRHGALLAIEDGRRTVALAAEPTLTKRGSRRAFSAMQRRMIEPACLGVSVPDPSGATLVASRLEAGRVVEEVRIPFPADPDDPFPGVREPRRPAPFGGEAAAAATPEGAG
jgi:hypothetical protein